MKRKPLAAVLGGLGVIAIVVGIVLLTRGGERTATPTPTPPRTRTVDVRYELERVFAARYEAAKVGTRSQDWTSFERLHDTAVFTVETRGAVSPWLRYYAKLRKSGYDDVVMVLGSVDAAEATIVLDETWHRQGVVETLHVTLWCRPGADGRYLISRAKIEPAAPTPPPPVPQPSRAELERALTELIAAWAKTFNIGLRRGNWAPWEEHLDPVYTVDVAGERIFDIAGYRAELTGSRIEVFKATIDRFRIGRDDGLADNEAELIITERFIKPPDERQVQSTMLLRRQTDGRWLIVREQLIEPP